MREYIIYKLTRNDNKEYIGTTDTKCFRSRMNAHKISERFREYTFAIEILEKSTNISLLEKEELYISKFNTYKKGLNKTPEGKGYGHNSNKFTTRGYKFSEEIKQKMKEKKKSYIPWNKGKTGYKLNVDRKGKCYRTPKFSDEVYKKIRELYAKKSHIESANTKQKNGKILTYERAFAKLYSPEFNISIPMVLNILNNKTLR
ncbi:MAG: hypothetical protein QGH83_11930 [Candidatus Pacebacteria bacterium]|jgi:hypothetical protein|nr:hypothetical protein [Candidatus Paceibacterota bacterium]|tara:strand:+ start:259 stop:864 length:606 start_codon:yes stop_codon:yes gene_type:complete